MERVYTRGWLAHTKRRGSPGAAVPGRQRGVRYTAETLYCRLHPDVRPVFCYAHEFTFPKRGRRRRVILALCLSAWCPRCSANCYGNALPLSEPRRELRRRPAAPRDRAPRERRWRWDAAARADLDYEMETP